VDGIIQHLAVQLIPHGGDMPTLFGAEYVARPANFQVPHGDTKTRSQIGILLDGLEPPGRRFGHGFAPRKEQVTIGPVFIPPNPSAKLVQIR